jgi:tetratricopeptide (TPR) repeat protein
MTESESNLRELAAADEKEQYGYARLLCEEVLMENPCHARTWVRYAANLGSLGLLDQAFKALDRAESLVPTERLHFVHTLRGQLLVQRGEFRAAETEFLRANTLKPGEAANLVFAASAAFRSGDLVGALKHAKLATECGEGCLDEAWLNRGGYNLALKRYAEAEICIRRSIELCPDDAIALARLSDVEAILAHERKKPAADLGAANP